MWLIPNPTERRLLRRMAEHAAAKPRVKIEAATRASLTGRGSAMNVALISDDPKWADTDLDDFRPWAAVLAGFETAAEGRALLDLWVYSMGRDGELETQITAIWFRDRLVRIEEHGAPLWVSTCDAWRAYEAWVDAQPQARPAVQNLQRPSAGCIERTENEPPHHTA